VQWTVQQEAQAERGDEEALDDGGVAEDVVAARGGAGSKVGRGRHLSGG
jgi:hypothetical protein